MYQCHVLSEVVVQKKPARTRAGQVIAGEEPRIMLKVRPTVNQADLWKHVIYFIKGLALNTRGGYVSDKHEGSCTRPDPERIIPQSPGGDCNDMNADVYPGAPDSDGNGVDENCDGVDGQACFGPRAFVLFLMPLAAWTRRTKTPEDSAP